MEERPSRRAQTFVIKNVMIIGVSVRNALATGRYVVEPTFIQRLKKYRDRPRRRRVHRVDQLIGRPDLAGSDQVLHLSHDHRYDCERLGDTRDFSDHADLDDLSFDLTEAGPESTPSSVGRNQEPCRPHKRVDDVPPAE